MCFLGLCVIASALDYRLRSIPRALPILGAILAGLFVSNLVDLVAGVVIGVGTGVVADLPHGDQAMGGMLGAWLGAEGIIVTWILALLLGHVLWVLWDERMIDWPGEWPFIPFLTVPACVIVLLKGGW
jgi:hypothetical protein